MSKILITPDQLAKSAHKFRRELLMMPIIGLERTTNHMTLRTGIQGKETVGEMSGSGEFGPYDPKRKGSDTNIVGRDLETFFGSIIEEFDPNDVVGSIYGSLITSGKELKDVDIVRQVVAFKMKQISKALNKAVFSAKRNSAGTKSADLFNGFDTITTDEIAAANISAAKGNLYELAAKIDKNNAVDALKEIYRTAYDELQEEDSKMYLPFEVYNAYVDDYQQTVGSVVYNTGFKKRYLEGSDDKCELVPLASKKGSEFIQLTPRENMLIGVDQMGNKEKISVDKFSAFEVTLSAAMFFGTQFESISPEKLLIAKLKTA